jgi:hypothetical protein
VPAEPEPDGSADDEPSASTNGAVVEAEQQSDTPSV